MTVEASPPARNALLAASAATLSSAQKVRLKAGEPLVGESGTVWFPLTAVVRVEVGMPPMLSGWIDNSGAVGLAEWLDGAAPEATWTVEVEGDAWVVSAERLAAMLEEAAFSRAVMAWLSRSITALRQEAVFNGRGSASERVVDLIVRLARHHQPSDSFTMNQAEIARLTGIQRTTVCAIMVRLKRAKLIGGARGRIRVLKPDLPDAALWTA